MGLLACLGFCQKMVLLGNLQISGELTNGGQNAVPRMCLKRTRFLLKIELTLDFMFWLPKNYFQFHFILKHKFVLFILKYFIN